MNRPFLKSNSMMQPFRTGKKTWKPAWRRRERGLLWLMKFSRRGHVLLEIRDPEARRVSFTCLEETTGRVRWEGMSFDESWWMGMEDTHQNVVFFHGYRKPDMPQHLGVRAIDCDTGERLWVDAEGTFLFAHERNVYVSRQRLGAAYHFALSIDTGEVVGEFGADASQFHPLRRSLNEEDAFAGYRYPATFDERHPLFGTHRDFVFSRVDVRKARGTIDVLQHGRLFLLSWHEVTGFDDALQQQLAQRFIARDEDSGAVVYEDVLSKERLQPGIDSFFLKDEQLFTIRNGNELVAHSLAVLP